MSAVGARAARASAGRSIAPRIRAPCRNAVGVPAPPPHATGPPTGSSGSSSARSTASPPRFGPPSPRSPWSSRTTPPRSSSRSRASDPDDALYGLYEGTPRTAWGADLVPFPNKISLFRLPLEEDFPDPDDLADEVRITVIHELAHHLGIDDDRLDELGLEYRFGAGLAPGRGDREDREERAPRRSRPTHRRLIPTPPASPSRLARDGLAGTVETARVTGQAEERHDLRRRREGAHGKGQAPERKHADDPRDRDQREPGRLRRIQRLEFATEWLEGPKREVGSGADAAKVNRKFATTENSDATTARREPGAGQADRAADGLPRRNVADDDPRPARR